MRDAHADRLAELFRDKFPTIKIETIHPTSGEITGRRPASRRTRPRTRIGMRPTA
jgi:hypothetical protein